MKFICENCKAKYQIGDDKISGRSVRMKCRRCGHLIQLSAAMIPGGAPAPEVHESAIIETASSAALSVSELLGTPPPSGVLDGPPKSSGTPAPGAPAPKGIARPAGASVPRTGGPLPPRVGQPLPRPGASPGPARPLGGAPLGGPARPPGGPAPLARPSGGPAPRPLGGPTPRPTGALGSPSKGAIGGAFQRSIPASPTGLTPPAGPALPAESHAPQGEDWYVGVNGVPLGPIRSAVIREKALAGSVHAESLVWREGFDEWQPLNQFPELLRIVEDAQAARAAQRPSAVPPALPPSARSGALASSTASGSPLPARPRQGPGVGLSRPGVGAPVRPPTLRPPSAAASLPNRSAATDPFAPPPVSSPAPLSSPSPQSASSLAVAGSAAAAFAPPVASPANPVAEPAAEADDLFGLGGPSPIARLSEPGSPIARLSEPGSGEAGPLAPAPGLMPPPDGALPGAHSPTPLPAGALDVMRDPFAVPPSAGSSAAGAPASTSGASGLGALVGGTAPPPSGQLAPPPKGEARPSEPPGSEERYVIPRQGLHPLAYAFIAMAAAFGAVVAYILVSRPPAQPTIVYVPQPATGEPSSAASTGAAPADTAEPASTGEAPAGDTSATPRASGPIALKGPMPTASSTATSAPVDTSGFGNQAVPGPSGGTGADPSLGQLSTGEIQGVVSASRARIRKRCWLPAMDASPGGGSAHVNGNIVIGPSGAVQSARASGAEKDYPGLSSCIAGQMQGWKFPPSSGTTPVNVPFVFARQ